MSAVAFFANQGVEVYVDWLDKGMPAETSPETAKRLRDMIQLNGKFVLLATPRSLGSRWVPWELGCADGLKGIENMAVMTVEDQAGTFPGNEYIGLYATICQLTGGWGVVKPGATSGVRLSHWLKN